MTPQGGSVYARSLAQSWLALPAKTRLFLSLGVCFVGAAGIFVSDQLEKKYPQEIKTEEKK